MASLRKRALRDNEIEKEVNLDESEFEDSGSDDGDIDDADYEPDLRRRRTETSPENSSSEDEVGSDESGSPVNPVPSRGSRGTSRATRGRSRGASSVSRRRAAFSSSRSRSRGGRQVAVRGTRSQNQDNDNDHGGSADAVWCEKTFVPNEVPLIEPAYLPVDSSSFNKLDYYRLYIPDDLMKVIVEKSNQMYLARTGRQLKLTLPECHVFIAIKLVMSCINYPILRMYWQQKFRVPIIADNMSRNRFYELRNAIKLVDDNLVSAEDRSKDRLWKVRPILDAVLNGCKNIPRSKNISIDEMIIPFTGACGIKQYCPGKPNPVGLKAFVLANPDGAICDFHIYQGSTTYAENENSSFGLGEKAVLTLADTLRPGHIIYCDRYFTTEKLVSELQNRGLMCTGTIMKNRIPKTARPLHKDDKDMKKESRGTSQVLVNEKQNMALTKWMDNKPVTFLSNIQADETIDACRRWCKRRKEYVTVPRPAVVKQYNANMGGVDLADRLLAVCPCRYRTKKWTVRFVDHMFDMAVTNAWVQFKNDELKKEIPVKKIQQLRSFKMEIAEMMLDAYVPTEPESSNNDEDEDEPLIKRTKASVQLPPEKVRLHGAQHLPSPGEPQNRCRKPGCTKKTTVICIRCEVYLCLTKERNCFYMFHTS